MFKFIHSADIHLDSPLRGLSRYESAPAESIRDACRRAFENLVDLAIEEEVAFVLLAGDLYDGDWKDYSTGIFLSKQMGRLGQHNIRVFAVSGNHDAANQMTKSLDSPSNMRIFSPKKVETVKLDDLGVAIHGRSFPTQHVYENLASGFCSAEKGLFNIGLLHTSLDGREGHAIYAPCSLDDLRSKGYQYWALGHIHKQEIVVEEPYVIFPGCIQGRHIREAGAKGCVLVSVDDGSVAEIEKVPLDVLRWCLCDIDLTDVDENREVLERVRKSIEQERTLAEDRPLAMRIRLQGATKIADELAAYPDRLEQQVKALGAETAGDNVWIERVENATIGKLDLESTLADDNALGRLLKEILNIANGTDEIDGLNEKIAELRQKAPSEAFGDDSILNLDDKQTVHRIVEEAKHMLIGRLLTVGGAK
ncbi:MAG: metallophosphoesterase family protein [Candidatus Loosdrechtia sp.]|uniref:metallophosphoesterase family protein n=1 Tax=Candidatus Loosdrechtia sp. TaxID=3101272 RepID=UPI003A7226E4|nr:MAG: DNA repair exonuclease [Candidatus Jettenia sp. AMX2]